MIVLVTGGRDYNDRNTVFHVLTTLTERDRDVEYGDGVFLVHGACGLDIDEPFDRTKLRGADWLAHQWAEQFLMPDQIEPMPAAWKRQGNRAGPIRNSDMVAFVAARSDIDKWCVRFPGGTGSADCMRKAQRAGFTTIEVHG